MRQLGRQYHFPPFPAPWRTRVASWSCEAVLFVYDLDLLVDYLAGKPVNRNVHPVMLLAFDEEACKSRSVSRIAAALGYYVNQQVPGASLTGVRKCAQDQLASFFV